MEIPTFRARFPEFARSSDALVSAVLEEAVVRAGGEGTGYQDRKVLYLAAHLLAVSPAGRELRTTPATTQAGDETTPYWREYSDLCRMEGAGPWCP